MLIQLSEWAFTEVQIAGADKPCVLKGVSIAAFLSSLVHYSLPYDPLKQNVTLREKLGEQDVAVAKVVYFERKP